ncbi:hypothetical protein FHS39_001677 [Streptomyces olivoverticillatus]|uniref:Secreted protein n=1 Tax=Streptomyces olivoverticillatus TaxID=66427 RepID=A0A7W7LN55_9ACTN|nr:SCO2322 family protein [Streptomyces olivoverticillatus]MBB4892666.1 hypothetical protein [Streptomyces olivoverticillatus]
MRQRGEVPCQASRGLCRPIGHALVPAVLLAVLAAGPAEAQGYRYWSFWQRPASAKSAQEWAYATQGPATARPGDGDSVGFRFAVSEDSAHAAKPRPAEDFAAVCDRTPAEEGTKRVAVVIDFGTAGDASGGEHPPAARTACAQVPGDASAAEALAAVAKPLRYDSNALLCAIEGYPRTGCGEKTDAPSDTSATPGTAPSSASASEGDGAGDVGPLFGVAAVLALGGAAWWQARRRRRG